MGGKVGPRASDKETELLKAKGNIEVAMIESALSIVRLGRVSCGDGLLAAACSFLQLMYEEEVADRKKAIDA